MSIEAGKELRVLFDVEPARIALDRFPYKFIARTHTRCPEMPVAQTNMPLRDGQAGLYPLFLMKSVHRIHPFIFCMVPVFQPVWCHGKTAVHCRNLALFRCFGALNWYHTPILVSLGYHAQPALRADVSGGHQILMSAFLLLSFSIPQKSVQRELHPAAKLLRFTDDRPVR